MPVPDTSKAAADAMAYSLGVPSVEGLIRNRYAGRTFIEGGAGRVAQGGGQVHAAAAKCSKASGCCWSRIRSSARRRCGCCSTAFASVGGAKEIHVRVACPPIIAPCFYGIDMSRIRELFAPPFVEKGLPSEEMFAEMAAELGADSLRYLPVESIARAIGKPADQLCRACITGDYPTPWGQKLYQVALDNYQSHADIAAERTYEAAATTAG